VTRAIQEKHACNFQKELKVEMFSKEEGRCHLFFFFPSVYLTILKKTEEGEI